MTKITNTETIFETALIVFARFGFRRTRMEDIADELDMATATLYRYVKDKRDLYEKTVSFGIQRWQAKVFEAVSPIADVTAQFVTMCRKGYGYLAEDVNLRQIMINDPTIFPLSPRKVRFPEIDAASIGLIKTILQKGIDTGVFRPIDVDHTAELFYSIYVMFIIKAYVKSEERSTREMFDEGLDLILNGLLKPQVLNGLLKPQGK